jgi:hypothetical protein
MTPTRDRGASDHTPVAQHRPDAGDGARQSNADRPPGIDGHDARARRRLSSLWRADLCGGIRAPLCGGIRDTPSTICIGPGSGWPSLTVAGRVGATGFSVDGCSPGVQGHAGLRRPAPVPSWGAGGHQGRRRLGPASWAFFAHLSRFPTARGTRSAPQRTHNPLLSPRRVVNPQDAHADGDRVITRGA